MQEKFIVRPRPQTGEKFVYITAELTPSLVQRLDELAQKLNWSESELITKALEFALDRIEDLRDE